MQLESTGEDMLEDVQRLQGVIRLGIAIQDVLFLLVCFVETTEDFLIVGITCSVHDVRI